MAGKYYWYKLPTKFFQNRFVKRLSKHENSSGLIIAYLKTILLAVPDDCRIMYDGEDDSIEDQIAFDTEMDIEIIRTLWAMMIEFNEAVQARHSSGPAVRKDISPSRS